MPGLLRDESGISELRATGLPLGLFSHSAADASIAVLRPDAALLIVSRGTMEARRRGKEFGLDMVKESLLSTTGQSAQEICDQLMRAANFIDKQRIGSTDDCGFSPFSIDEKPSHGSPDYARDIAFQKIKNRVEGTRMAAEKLGVS